KDYYAVDVSAAGTPATGRAMQKVSAVVHSAFGFQSAGWDPKEDVPVSSPTQKVTDPLGIGLQFRHAVIEQPGTVKLELPKDGFGVTWQPDATALLTTAGAQYGLAATIVLAVPQGRVLDGRLELR